MGKTFLQEEEGEEEEEEKQFQNNFKALASQAKS